jgi:hypothetical protein
MKNTKVDGKWERRMDLAMKHSLMAATKVNFHKQAIQSNFPVLTY